MSLPTPTITIANIHNSALVKINKDQRPHSPLSASRTKTRAIRWWSDQSTVWKTSLNIFLGDKTPLT
jgi:hypothetical protein